MQCHPLSLNQTRDCTCSKYMMMQSVAPILALLAVAGVTASPATQHVAVDVKRALDSRLANVHVSAAGFQGRELTITYGTCDDETQHQAHHTVGRSPGEGDSRLVWLLPDSITSGGCLSAWDSRQILVGRSQTLSVEKSHRQWTKRDVIPMSNASGIDAEGPWFDGVTLLKNKEIGAVDVKAAKAKKIGILGAGMAGKSYLRRVLAPMC